ncbi:MAG: NAD-dependent epimerase/dehydratase family protein [Vicingaceae bacterium]
MHVLITGGAGYIGTALVEKLNQNKTISRIDIYDNLSRSNRNFFIGKDKLNHSKVNFIQGDLLDSRKLKNALKGVDVVYHLAANVTTPFSDQNPHLFEQVNHWGTAELTYAVEESEVKRLIYLSSVSVYGSSEDIYRLADQPNPQTFYGISKLRGEEHIQRLSEKLETYVIRCGNVYGYNKSMRFDAVINRFMFEANFKGRITINGTGEQHRPFVHIQDAAAVLSALVEASLAKGTYNLVDRNLAIGEVVEALREVYPDLEMLFVNQHMKMRELKVEASAELRAFFTDEETPLAEQLGKFREAFTF